MERDLIRRKRKQNMFLVYSAHTWRIHPDIDLIHVPDYKDHPKIKKYEEEYLSKWNKPQFEELYPGTHFCVFQKKKMQS